MSNPQSHLSLQLKHRLGALDIDAAFELTQPWTVLFGPSGSGKSTILRAIAGLMEPTDARIVVYWRNQARIVTNTAAKVAVAPHERPVRWAAQSAALFPHMTVRENLCLASEIKNSDRKQAIEHALQCFQLGQLAERKPASLSGGEQQRVSIARAALAANGRLLLLDEPFSGIDLTLRGELVSDLQQWLALTNTPVLSVTHDVAEALQLGAEVIKLREGKVIAQGAASTVLAEERGLLLAQLSAIG